MVGFAISFTSNDATFGAAASGWVRRTP
jgi:hypothetical protein